MKITIKHLDRYLLAMLLALLIGLPLSVRAYDRSVWAGRIPAGAKVFTLTGSMDRGWILGRLRAYEVLTMAKNYPRSSRPIIRVAKGDRVVLKLTSSDVVHGFRLMALGVSLDDDIKPGEVQLISFVAEKAGTFTFSCNALCGVNHARMLGTLIVT